MTAARRSPRGGPHRRTGGGEVVLVTGASGGVGRATARAFGARGCSVALLARGEYALQRVADEVRQAGGRALPLVVDVADAQAVDADAAVAGGAGGRAQDGGVEASLRRTAHSSRSAWTKAWGRLPRS